MTNMMTIVIGADHGGYELKQLLIPLIKKSFPIVDMGAAAYDASDDYPDYAIAVAHAISNHQADKGIIICGSGVGACVAANKIAGIRAAICHDTYSAHQGVEHDDMNILCLGARVIGIEVAKEIVTAFLQAEFINADRYQRRLDKVLALENKQDERKS